MTALVLWCPMQCYGSVSSSDAASLLRLTKILYSSFYKNPDGFLGRYAYFNEERLGPRDHPR